MKKVEKILDSLCVICTIVFFLAVTAMIFAQGFAVITLDGPMSKAISKAIAEPASLVSAVATVIAIILAYLRGQMNSI